MGLKGQSDPVGLSALLTSPREDPSVCHPNAKPADSLLMTLKHVLDLSDREVAMLAGGWQHSQLANLLQQRKNLIDSTESTEPETSTVRLGPPKVVPDRASMSGQFSHGSTGIVLESLSNFSSFRANTCVFGGRWM